VRFKSVEIAVFSSVRLKSAPQSCNGAGKSSTAFIALQLCQEMFDVDVQKGDVDKMSINK